MTLVLEVENHGSLGSEFYLREIFHSYSIRSHLIDRTACQSVSRQVLGKVSYNLPASILF